MQQSCDEKRTTGENKVGKVGFGSLRGGSAPVYSLTQAVTAIWSQGGATAHVRDCTDGERDRREPQQEKSGKDKGLSTL